MEAARLYWYRTVWPLVSGCLVQVETVLTENGKISWGICCPGYLVWLMAADLVVTTGLDEAGKCSCC